MLATILIVVMVLLHTGALSFGLADRRLITVAVSLKRKLALLNKHNRERQDVHY